MKPKIMLPDIHMPVAEFTELFEASIFSETEEERKAAKEKLNARHTEIANNRRKYGRTKHEVN